MAHSPKRSEAMQSTRNTDVVSVSSDECEITRVIPHNACNADTQANDWLSAEATPQGLVSAGQGPSEGVFPVVSVFQPEQLRERLDKDGGSARPLLFLLMLLVLLSRNLILPRVTLPQ